jgi:S-adenosylmethionine synthetase
MKKELLLHTFEAGRRGKPDEFESQIAELLGAYILQKDTDARFDLRVNGGFDKSENQLYIRIGGEISQHIYNLKDLNNDFSQIIRNHYQKIYKNSAESTELLIKFELTPQSVALASNDQAAGDIGTSIAIAFAQTPVYLPIERFLAIEIRDLIDQIYLNDGEVPHDLANSTGIKHINGLRADGKVEVNAYYSEYVAFSIRDINYVFAHEENTSAIDISNDLNKLIYHKLDNLQSIYKDINFINANINMCNIGNWNMGGWRDDAGSREAKPYRDGFASHGTSEDSFTGEDPTKPSAMGSLFARYIATSIIRSDLAKIARVTLTFQGGKKSPNINIFTYGTGVIEQLELEKLIYDNIDSSISDIIQILELKNYKTFINIADNSDFFSSEEYIWNIGKALYNKV